MAIEWTSAECVAVSAAAALRHADRLLDRPAASRVLSRFSRFARRRSAQEGLKSHEVSISSQCAAAIENLAIYHFTHAPEGERTEAGRMLSAHLSKEPALFQGLLSTLLQIIVFEECANQWSLSRPLLPLILINTDFFNQWQEQARARPEPRVCPSRVRLGAAQPASHARSRARARASRLRSARPVHAQLIAQQAGTPERQQKLVAAFQKLMAEVQCNLESKNRDKITTNLTLFRHEVKALF
jgi:exportin-7